MYDTPRVLQPTDARPLGPGPHPGSPGGRLRRGAHLLLPAGAVLALIWANTLPDSYFRFRRRRLFW